ncbi:class I SAM-dependent methyltransferase [Aneurinibacillus aneurinilyticus]|uniref:Class I SAM-dependent methyltransferase n=1 Tax=Aneurinibacillus aneurinilyticus TaxID=1391 RepID=A0A848D005_ANEAE|nr:class I SAM-dependent methyltransferase [Aneurinibacillus aneurinilyticus]MED0673036.1 class I SAM-dependent methyltransferase [Aneurinibacillus aneurinilyticus]NMF01324.1 class I SAM-dependent methyltransferase [Aneurinibacillus aneurinilyticus]
MSIKKYTEANRKAWNEVTPIHQQARNIDLKEKFSTKGFSLLDEVITEKLKEINIQDKTVAQLCCNNGIELLSIINLGAKSGTGFDISDYAIQEANELAQVSHLPCTFIRTDVYDIGKEHAGQYDLVYISIGALTWLPDLQRFFTIVSDLLKKEGMLLIYDMHPFLNMFAVKGEAEFEAPLKVAFSYYKNDPWVSYEGIDYIGGTTYKSRPNYSFSHTLSSLLNSIMKSGIHIKEFSEYHHDISCLFGHLEEENKLPLSYILVGSK